MAVGGVHDMGGAPGYGPVEPEENEPVFHDEWEGRVFGLVVSIQGGFRRSNLEHIIRVWSRRRCESRGTGYRPSPV